MTRIATFNLRPAIVDNGLYVLDTDGEPQLLTTSDLEALRALIDAQLPRGEHNHEVADPDAHVLFPSVCCGAQLYRCEQLQGPLPSKPLIAHGENTCRNCGATLIPF